MRRQWFLDIIYEAKIQKNQNAIEYMSNLFLSQAAVGMSVWGGLLYFSILKIYGQINTLKKFIVKSPLYTIDIRQITNKIFLEN